jgi:hypothetical protein
VRALHLNFRKGFVMMAHCSIHGLQPYYFVSPDLQNVDVGVVPEIVLVDVVHEGEVMWTIAVSNSFAGKYSLVDEPVDCERASSSAWFPELTSMCCECYRERDPK